MKKEIDKLPAPVGAVALLPGGELGAAVCGQTSATLRIFPLPAEQVPSLKREFLAPAAIQALAFAPKDLRAVSVDGQGVRVWYLDGDNTLSAEIAGAIPGSSVTYSPEGARVLLARAQPDRDGYGPMAVAVLQQGLSPANPQLLRFRGHAGGTNAAAYIKNGANVVSGGNDGYLRFWETSSEREIDSIATDGPVRMIAATIDGSKGVVAGDQPSIDIWDLNARTRLGSLEGHELPVRAVRLAKNQPIAASGSSDRTARVWNVALRECLAVLMHPAAVTDVDLTASGQFLLTGCADGILRLWDVPTRSLVRAFPAHRAAITAVALSPNGRTALSASQDHVLCWWDLPERKTAQE